MKPKKPKKPTQQELYFFGVPHAWLGKRGLAPDVKPWIEATLPVLSVGLNSMVAVYYAAWMTAAARAADKDTSVKLLFAADSLGMLAGELIKRGYPAGFAEAVLRDIESMQSGAGVANDTEMFGVKPPNTEHFKPMVQRAIDVADQLYDEYGARHLIMSIGISADGVRGLAKRDGWTDVSAYMVQVMHMLEHVWQSLPEN